MAALPPTTALPVMERSLRQLYAVAFEARWGPDWLSHVTPANRLTSWQEKQATEKRRRGTRGAVVPTDLLKFAEFHELVELAEKNWQDVAPALGEKKDTFALLRRFEQLRNTVAHSRELLSFEEDLLSGIAGEIRNRVTIYMSSQPTSEYWARIESVTDSFGNTVDGAQTVETSNPYCETGLDLRVGDRVTFDCQATDPLGRNISWAINIMPDDGANPQHQGRDGDHVSFTWTVTERHASSQTWARISMQAASPSHRWPEGRDGLAMFKYRVLPAD